MDKIVLIGGGGHARSVADSIESCGQYQIVGYTDINQDASYLTYLGTDEELHSLYKSGVQNAAICVGYLGKSTIRDRLYSLAKDIGFILPPIIDPSAIVSQRCEIGEGTFIGKDVCINSDTRIGKMCIINSHATVEHDTLIGDYSHVAVGAVLCGGVKIDTHVLIGANATVIQGITISANSIVGAGSTVLHDVPDSVTVYGVV